MLEHAIKFPFSDTVSGHITTYDPQAKTGIIATKLGKYAFELHDRCTAQMVHGLDEASQDLTKEMDTLLAKGPFIFAMGIFYPMTESLIFAVHHLIFLGKERENFRFEEEGWWVRQADSIAEFYLQAQFEGGPIDYKKFRTYLTLHGGKDKHHARQETNSFSRLICGLANAYLLTGKDIYLESAEKGIEYFSNHMRVYDSKEDLVYWYHAVDVETANEQERKILGSQYPDDSGGIVACEQIYALSGLTQTYRITGDPEILQTIEGTLKLFDRYFYDKEKKGYFSHIDPVTFDPRSSNLRFNAAKKNWNSIGDHASVYLFNLWCATNDPKYAKTLEEICDLIVQYFAKNEGRFVHERFFEDWSPDLSYLWQQKDPIIGHNLKIAWILLRAFGLFGKKEYLDTSKNILADMAEVGLDQLRGGWFDLVAREARDGEKRHRFTYHDRKAWWQQEQGILVYQLAAGLFKDPAYAKIARESSAFYNAFFLDHQDGAVFAGVQANGLPYLQGVDRYKGSRWMSAFHSEELAFYATVYSDLFLFDRPVDLYFKPKPNGFKNRQLFVTPDTFPEKSIVIGAVWIEGKPYKQFENKTLSVHLPDSQTSLNVKVRLKKGNV